MGDHLWVPMEMAIRRRVSKHHPVMWRHCAAGLWNTVGHPVHVPGAHQLLGTRTKNTIVVKVVTGAVHIPVDLGMIVGAYRIQCRHLGPGLFLQCVIAVLGVADHTRVTRMIGVRTAVDHLPRPCLRSETFQGSIATGRPPGVLRHPLLILVLPPLRRPVLILVLPRPHRRTTDVSAVTSGIIVGREVPVRVPTCTVAVAPVHILDPPPARLLEGRVHIRGVTLRPGAAVPKALGHVPTGLGPKVQQRNSNETLHVQSVY